MKSKQPLAYVVSAGGVVIRTVGNRKEIVLCGRRQPMIWSLPKGTPDYGETREETAIREVVEETGLQVRIDGFIGTIEYWFSRHNDGRRCHKSVFFYLMTATGGDTSCHDDEFDDVRWFPVAEALTTMAYRNEAKIVEKGLSLAS